MDQNRYLSKFKSSLTLTKDNNEKLINYERVTRSLLLIMIKAAAMTATTNPPATKLDRKFANEVVISNSVFLNKN